MGLWHLCFCQAIELRGDHAWSTRIVMADFLQLRKPPSCRLQWWHRQHHCSVVLVQFTYFFFPDCCKLSIAALTKQSAGRDGFRILTDQSLVSGGLAYIYLLQIILARSLSNLYMSFEKIMFERLVEDMKSLFCLLIVLYHNEIKIS